MDRFLVFGLSTESANDLDRGPQLVERVEPDDFGIFQIKGALIGIFFEEALEDLAGKAFVAAEDIALPNGIGAFLAGKRGLVVGDMANEVEGIEGGADFLLESGEEHAPGLELLDDGLFAVGMGPVGEEIIKRGVVFENVPAGVVTKALGDDLAIVVHVLNPLLNDGDFHAVHGDLACASVWDRVL